MSKLLLSENFEKACNLSIQVHKTLEIKRNATKQEFFPKYKDWPEQWKEQFWEIAGETMNHFGYSE